MKNQDLPGHSSVTEYFPSMYEALGSIFINSKEKTLVTINFYCNFNYYFVLEKKRLSRKEIPYLELDWIPYCLETESRQDSFMSTSVASDISLRDQNPVKKGRKKKVAMGRKAGVCVPRTSLFLHYPESS